MKYILAGHGELPEGTLKTVELLIGKREDIEIVSEKNENDDYKRQLDQLIQKYQNEGLIIFTDLLEGAINQYCMRRLQECNFYLICGMNVPLLLEILLKPKATFQDIQEIVALARQQMLYVNDLMGAYDQIT